MHPAVARATAYAIALPEPQAQQQRRHGQQRGETHQLARHQQQALALGDRPRCDHGQIHEDTWQIEKSREPARNEHDMKSFNP
ncbi:hypothetical protein D3C72_2385180 [compost metagenome]